MASKLLQGSYFGSTGARPPPAGACLSLTTWTAWWLICRCCRARSNLPARRRRMVGRACLGSLVGASGYTQHSCSTPALASPSCHPAAAAASPVPSQETLPTLGVCCSSGPPTSNFRLVPKKRSRAAIHRMPKTDSASASLRLSRLTIVERGVGGGGGEKSCRALDGEAPATHDQVPAATASFSSH